MSQMIDSSCKFRFMKRKRLMDYNLANILHQRQFR